MFRLQNLMNFSRDFSLNQQPRGVIRSRCQSKSQLMFSGGQLLTIIETTTITIMITMTIMIVIIMMFWGTWETIYEGKENRLETEDWKAKETSKITFKTSVKASGQTTKIVKSFLNNIFYNLFPLNNNICLHQHTIHYITYILLDVLLCSIAEYFYELCRILANP